MSKPSKNPRARKTNVQMPEKTLLRAGIVFLVLAAVVAGVALLSPSNQSSYVPEVTGAPRLAVSQEVVDFGDVPVSQPVRAVFHVRNVGDQTLRVLDNEPLLTVVEGCCPPRARLSTTTIQPGDEAVLSVQFTMNPGMDGPHDFRIHLRTNDPLEPEKELQILSNWVS